MINVNSVIALDNSFVTVSRLLPNQILMGVSPTPLVKVLEDSSEGVLVETDSFSIITSPHQLFIISPTEVREAKDLEFGDSVLTVYGFEPVKFAYGSSNVFRMANVITQSRFLLSEGFYLLSD
jgi:hypothetical protein